MFNKPEKVGNYTIIELLGQGSYGAVYLGEHVVTKHQAAIKVLRAILDAGTRAKFEKEARIIAQLSNPNSRHPHIVMLLDCRVDGDIPYLVMEYASSGNLRKTHPLGTQLPLALVVDYTRQIALALQHAHDQDVIHRDVKPENILVGRHGELLLSDFGIATVGQGTKNPLPQEPAGTYRYMAPEQTTNHELLRRSDQYSLGIVVYEWLAGTVPFDEEPWELPEKHAKEPPPSLLLKRPGLPSTVEQVVLKALAKDPNDRFPSVTAFAEALEEDDKAH
jgi:serine/threonine protein kinase